MFIHLYFFKAIKKVPWVLFGVFLALFFVLLIVLGSPVYIFRAIAIALAKAFRPDLDKILNGQSVMYVSDYFSHRSPRASLVLASIFEGQLTAEEMKAVVQDRWIEARHEQTGELIFNKFQQYPVRWLGFTFWRNELAKFSIDNHVHKLFGKDTPVSHEQLTDIIEKVMNDTHPPKKSPWEFYIIENYKPATAEKYSQDAVTHSVALFKHHHVLSDGYGMLVAFDKISDNHSKNSLRFPTAATVNKCSRKLLQKFISLCFSVVVTFTEISNIMWHALRKSQWKIPDRKKGWHQLIIKAEPISTRVIKEIKNHFKVSFNTVLISAISSAISKCHQKQIKIGYGKTTRHHSELILTMFPVPSRHREKQVLTNQVAGAFLDIPVVSYDDPVERLQAVNKIMERAKMSMIPLLSRTLACLMGHHLNPIARFLFKNKWVPIGLSNFPGSLVNVQINGKVLIENFIVAGGLEGEAGIAITTLTHNDQFSMLLSMDSGLMSREMATGFFQDLSNEINCLHDLKRGVQSS